MYPAAACVAACAWMEPTKAPWADPAVAACPPPDVTGTALPTTSRRGVHTGNPIKPVIEVDPALPPVRPDGWPSTWKPAEKRIRSQQDVQAALQGYTLRSFVAFTLSLSEAVAGLPQAHQCHLSNAAQAVIAALDRLGDLCSETPASTHEVRYGNPAYRAWFDKMQEVVPELVYDILGDELGPATVALVPYLLDSFGNRSRIDYGTGHETTFLMFLYCLFALGALQQEDQEAVVLRVFKRYLDLMRQLQTTYWCARTCRFDVSFTMSGLCIRLQDRILKVCVEASFASCPTLLAGTVL